MSIAIIGAGIAGLTAAYTLRDAVPDITVFEKSRGFGGRAATRWYDRPQGRVFIDHGAQYIKTEGPSLERLMLRELSRTDLSDIARPVWTFDAGSQIREGDAEHNARPKWSYRQGLATLGRLLGASLKVITQVRIGQITLNAEGRFALLDADKQPVGEFDQVIVGIPAGQAADLIAASALPEKLHLETELRAAVYRRCQSVILGFERRLNPRPYYALVNTDRAHPISWVGFEHDKPGHMPEGYSALVVQMAGAYSEGHWEDDAEAVIADVARRTSELLGEDVTDAAWSDMQRWRYSLPDTLANAQALNGVVDGLWFVGDYLRGGRVHLAAETGHEVAQAMRIAAGR